MSMKDFSTATISESVAPMKARKRSLSKASGAVPPLVGVLFDMDGTLLKLPVEIDEARQELRAFFAARGFESPFRPLLPELRRAARHLGGEKWSSIEQQGLRILDRYEVSAANAVEWFDGAIDVLAHLDTRRIPFGLVTNNGRAALGHALQRIGGPKRFTCILTRDDVHDPKPAPEGLIKAWRLLGGCRGRVAWIGDGVHDVEAGRKASSSCPHLVICRLAWGMRQTRDETASAPSKEGILTFSSLSDFSSWIDSELNSLEKERRRCVTEDPRRGRKRGNESRDETPEYPCSGNNQ